MKRKRRKKWKERKKKRKMKIKKRTKERKEGFPIEDRKEVKRGKEATLDQRKEENRKSPKPDCHSESFLTGNIPPHMNKEEKTETTSFLSKNADLEKILLVRDRTFDL